MLHFAFSLTLVQPIKNKQYVYHKSDKFNTILYFFVEKYMRGKK